MIAVAGEAEWQADTVRASHNRQDNTESAEGVGAIRWGYLVAVKVPACDMNTFPVAQAVRILVDSQNPTMLDIDQLCSAVRQPKPPCLRSLVSPFSVSRSPAKW